MKSVTRCHVSTSSSYSDAMYRLIPSGHSRRRESASSASRLSSSSPSVSASTSARHLATRDCASGLVGSESRIEAQSRNNVRLGDGALRVGADPRDDVLVERTPLVRRPVLVMVFPGFPHPVGVVLPHHVDVLHLHHPDHLLKDWPESRGPASVAGPRVPPAAAGTLQ